MVRIGRRGGKTELALNEVVKRAVTVPGLYWYLGPSYRQTKAIAWVRLKSLLKNDPDWKFNEQELSADHTKINTRIELKGTDNEDSLRGTGLNGAVLDECAFMKANVWPEIVRPMLADKQGWALFISTPKGRNWFYDIYNKQDQSEDWKSWHYPTNINRYIKPEEIAEAKKDMSERLFKQEFDAEFLDDETGVFKRIRTCITGELEAPKQGRFYVMGIDLAKTEDFTVLTVLDTVTRHVVFQDRFNDISWKEQKLLIQKWAKVYNNALLVVDSTGVGDPIFEDLRNANLSVESFKFTSESKHKLIEQLSIAIEQRQITFPPSLEIMIAELMEYEYTLTNSGNIKYGAPEGKHDDCVISLALAVWGIRSYLYEAQVIQSTPTPDPIDKQGGGEKVVNYEFADSIAGY